VARKILLYQTGGAEVLKIVEVPTPEPRTGDVRLRVRAIGINRSEINSRAGTYGQPPSLPAQLGFEAAGEIDALGPGVSGFSIGDAVSVLPGFSSTQYGMYGDLVLAPARLLVKHPGTLTWIEAAATWMQFGTAWAGLVDIADTTRGDFVLITTPSSSVGLAAIQVARRHNA
jgi:NADPH:quinone reductase-like Zn-dependent oxidoreductase